MRTLLLLLFISQYNTCFFCQISIKKIPVLDCDDRRFYTFQPNQQSYDTISNQYAYYFYKYMNEKRLEKVFFNDSLWIDSVYRYYDNGKIAFKGYLKKYNLWETKYEGLYNLSNVYFKTYYSNEKIRSQNVLEVKENSKNLKIEQIFDTNSNLIYSEKIYYGDTVEGSFVLDYNSIKNDTKCIKIALYDKMQLIEIWYIVDEKNVKLLEVEEFQKGKKNVINSKKKLKQKLKRSPLFVKNCDYYIAINSLKHVEFIENQEFK
jgi:hypothetical protein